MALKTTGDIMTEVLVRNNRSTTDGFITDVILQGWLKDAHIWAASYRKWSMTEGRLSTTYATTEEWYFEGLKADSVRMITVGTDLFQKVNFKDYLQMKDDQSASTQKIYSDYGRALFVNSTSGASGTMTVYGQFQPALDVTDLTLDTIFSSYDEEGNEAIVEKMTSYLKRKEHNPQEAELHDKRASDKLLEVASRIGDEQSNYQIRNGDGMFKRFDVLNGGFREDIFKRDQFS